MSFCSFKSSQICECVGKNSPLTSLSSELQSIILTEAGLLPSDITQKFQVCSEHFHRFLNKNKAGCKSKICGIPDIISSHNKDNKIYGGWSGVKADRNVSLEKVKEIHARTEIIVPVGTSICPRCRKTLCCGQSTSCSLIENFANKNCLMNSDNLGDTCSCQYEEQYYLRPYRLTSGYNVLYYKYRLDYSKMLEYGCGILPLRLETGRFVGEPEYQRIFRMCDSGHVENELHSPIECQFYNGLRNQLFSGLKFE